MKWWNSIIAYLRKLPIARWIKPLWKSALRAVVKAALNEAQKESLEAIAKDGPRAVDRNVDALQEKIKRGLHSLPLLPDGVENKIISIVQEKGDELQIKLKSAVESGGLLAADAAFDSASQAILARIDAL